MSADRLIHRYTHTHTHIRQLMSYELVYTSIHSSINKYICIHSAVSVKKHSSMLQNPIVQSGAALASCPSLQNPIVQSGAALTSSPSLQNPIVQSGAALTYCCTKPNRPIRRCAHLLPEPAAELLGDAFRDRHGGDPAGLRAPDLPPHRVARLRQVLRDLRRLPRSRLPDHDQDLVVVHRLKVGRRDTVTTASASESRSVQHGY